MDKLKGMAKQIKPPYPPSSKIAPRIYPMHSLKYILFHKELQTVTNGHFFQ